MKIAARIIRSSRNPFFEQTKSERAIFIKKIKGSL